MDRQDSAASKQWNSYNVEIKTVESLYHVDAINDLELREIVSQFEVAEMILLYSRIRHLYRSVTVPLRG